MSLMAELVAIVMVLHHIRNRMEYFNSVPILIRYDCVVACKLLLRQNRTRLPEFVKVVRAGINLLKSINDIRLVAAEESLRPQGTRATTSLMANRIQFQHVFSHQNEDLGNEWADFRADTGARLGKSYNTESSEPDFEIFPNLPSFPVKPPRATPTGVSQDGIRTYRLEYITTPATNT